MKLIKKMQGPALAIAVMGGTLVAHSALAAGTPVVFGNTNSTNNTPLGGVGTGFPQLYQGDYQQVYLGSKLGGVVTISEVDFMTSSATGFAEPMTFDLDINLSNTTATPAAPGTSNGAANSGTLAANEGANNVKVFSTSVTGAVTITTLANGTFDVPFVFATPFVYDPASAAGGNLLMDITIRSVIDGGANPLTNFFVSNKNGSVPASGNTTGRVFFTDANQTATTATGNSGLYTQFLTGGVVVSPEPSPAIVMLVGGLGLLAAAKRRRFVRGE